MADTEHMPGRLIGAPALLAVLVAGALLVTAIWLRTGLIGAEQWPVRWLDVEGSLQRISASQVRSAAIGPASHGVFAVDLDEVRRAVEALPWVAEASVSRQWPDALTVRVVEHRPVARWNDDRLLSDRGEVFEVSGSSSMQGMALLTGPESRRDEVLDQWRRMRRELGSIGQDIARMGVDERGAWTLRLDSGLELALGRDHMDQRLQRYIRVHDELHAQGRPLARIDLRYTNGVAVRWADQPASEEADHG